MRVVTNDHKIKVGRRSGTIMFFVSLAVLMGGLFLTNFIPFTPESSWVLLIVPCIVMPLGIIATAVSIRLTNEYVRIPRPERALAVALAGIHNKAVLFNYFPQAKHILITPHGVYVLTTRFQMTRVSVKGSKWFDYKARGPLAPFFQFMKQERMGNPFDDANVEAGRVQAVLDAALPESQIEVEPTVVFLNERAVLELEGPDYPVAYASAKKKPNIKQVLKDEKKDKQRDEFTPLSDEELLAIEQALYDTLQPIEQNRLVYEEEANE